MNIIKNKLFVAGAVGVVVILVVFLSGVGIKNKNLNNSVVESPFVSSSVNPSVTPSGKDLQSLTPKELEKLLGGKVVDSSIYAKLTKPATCNVSGAIKFFSQTSAEILKAKIVYTGIDSEARQIKWNVAPKDDLRVGPNLAASLELPDGESAVGVTLPEFPISKNYTLTSSITYGRLVNGEVKIYEATCAGQIGVALSY